MRMYLRGIFLIFSPAHSLKKSKKNRLYSAYLLACICHNIRFPLNYIVAIIFILHIPRKIFNSDSELKLVSPNPDFHKS